MQLKPLGNHVVLEAAPKETVTASGIIIPDTVSSEKIKRGVVVAVGPGKLLENGSRQAIDVAVGDEVIYSWSQQEMELPEGDQKKKYLIVSADEILAVLTK